MPLIPFYRPGPIRIPLPDIGLLPEHLELHPFGLLVATGVLLGARLALYRARKEGLHPKVVGELIGYVLISGFVLGHMLDAVFYHWDEVRARPFFLLELHNGLSSFGGFTGAALGGLIWRIRRRASLVAFADPLAWAFPLGWLFGRIGCFVVHDHPGTITDFPLAVADYQVPGHSPPFPARHDLGLYEAFFALVLLGLFLWLGQKRRPRGFYLALLPILYSPVRFGLDFLRATDITGHDPRTLGMTPGHFGALALLLAGIAVAIWVAKAPPPEIPAWLAWPEPGAPEEATPGLTTGDASERPRPKRREGRSS